ncbi:extracellular solute-binding protein [Eremococcus coleocola]|uniref:ABC transporter, solute-binding protein n=1 Tax=Eremococcus coleocola ACS-139-V-Col8 TaxID=908337 RepID=E4KML5_9LACT|nr:extracellular solute-binding protein [Eremococcus coleocola]EFR31696.1 ABC transporter, solute-binding protein [Eremococcus coleocola ACS-139-V-Col8]
MKKFLKKVTCAALTLGTLAGLISPTAFAQDKQTITLWTGGSDNIRLVYEELEKAFDSSEYGKKYDLEIQFVLSGSGAQSVRDRIVAAAAAGEKETDFDIVEMGADEFVSYTADNSAEDMFLPLDFSKIPNSENVEAQVAEGSEYLIPFRGTTVVLAYDEERVDKVPTTSEELYQWIKDHPGRFAYNTPGSGGAGSSFVTTAIYNNLDEEALVSDDPANMEKWDQGFDLLKDLHGSLYQSGGKTVYPNKNQGTIDLLIDQQVDMIPAWADQIISQINQGILPETTKITQIDPAFTGGLVTFAIPTIGRQAENPEGAYAFFDFMLSEQAQQILLDNMAAIPLIDSSNMDSANAELLKDLDVTNFRRTSLGELGGQLTERWDKEIGTLN